MDICETESLCCTPEMNTTLKSIILQYKVKIKQKLGQSSWMPL